MSKVVWCNGVFDIIHASHVELFATARHLAGAEGRVIVGLDSDTKVRSSKGPERPINTFEDRKAVLKAIRYIDEVYEFETREGLTNLIELFRPDIMLLGGDWRHGEVVGREFCQDVRFLERRERHSTTNIIQRCKDA